MAFNSITQAEIAAGQPVTQSLWQKVKDNDDYLYSQIGAGGGSVEGGIPNGSFEIDADQDGVPDGWTKNLYPAGGGAIETANPAHGDKAYKFVQQAGPGNGGGYLEMNDYLPCAPLVPLVFSWLHYATAAGMHNLVQVRWFDKTKIYLSTSDVYNSTSNPTSWEWITALAFPPSSARFWKLRIIGGYTDTDIAGSAWFDGVDVTTRMPTVYSYSLGLGTDAAPLSTNSTGWVTPAGGSIPIVLPDISGGWWVRATVKGYVRGGAGYPLYQYAHARILLGDNNSEETIATADPSNYALRYFHAYAKISGTGYLQIRLFVDHSSYVSQMYVPAYGVLIEILGR